MDCMYAGTLLANYRISACIIILLFGIDVKRDDGRASDTVRFSIVASHIIAFDTIQVKIGRIRETDAAQVRK